MSEELFTEMLSTKEKILQTSVIGAVVLNEVRTLARYGNTVELRAK